MFKDQDNNERHWEIFEIVDEGIVIQDEEENFLFANRAAREIFQVDKLVGRNAVEFVTDRGINKIKSATKRRTQGISDSYLLNIIRADGEERVIHITASPKESKDSSEELKIYAVFRDITEQIRREQQLQEKEMKLKAITDSVLDAIIMINSIDEITFWNPAAENILGYKKEEVIGKKLHDFLVPEEQKQRARRGLERFAKSGEGYAIGRNLELTAITKKGEEIIVSLSLNSLKIKDEWHAVGIIRDITEQKEQEKQINYLLYHDRLTDLYNHRFFSEEMKRLDTRRQLPISIIMIDVNGLKIINDSFGHKKGDELLQKTAEILKKSCREEDIVARWGGDEFVILLPKTSRHDAKKIYDRIKDYCQQTQQETLTVSLGMGIATKTEPGQNIEEILNDADDKMYQNKIMESRSTKSSVVKSVLNTLGAKSDETEEHAMRMTKTAYDIGKELQLSPDELNQLSLLATLHDIGKATIPESILTKESKLTDEEWEIMKEHPERGYRIASATEEFSRVADLILSHHEQWDGKGYPRGLQKNEIPLLARIITIVDAYDVMTHDRPYKKAINKTAAIAELKACAGTQFDPELVDKFIALLE